MNLNRMNQSAAHSTSYESVETNLNQMPEFIDLTDDGNGFSTLIGRDVIDLTNIPEEVDQCSVDYPKTSTTDANVIDLTTDLLHNENNVSSASTITEALDSYELMSSIRNVSPAMPVIVDLTEESLLLPITSQTCCPSEISTTQVTEDRSIDVGTTVHLNDRILRDERNSALQLPVVVGLTDSVACQVATTDETTDPSTQSANDRTLEDEQSSALQLPLVVASTESLLCPIANIDPSNQSECTMDWESVNDSKELNEHLESLQEKISTLENATVDLNDESDTSFLLIEGYKTQACQIYERIRKLTGNVKRAKDRIKFNGTPFPEFNAKLERYVNRKKRLPIFGKMLKALSTYNRDSNLEFNQEDCYRLVQKSLTKIGRKLQKQRRISLDETFSYYTKNQIDPADVDPELRAKLDRKPNK